MPAHGSGDRKFLDANLHLHCCVIDGLFSAEDEGVKFHPAFPTDAPLASRARYLWAILILHREAARRLARMERVP